MSSQGAAEWFDARELRPQVHVETRGEQTERSADRRALASHRLESAEARSPEETVCYVRALAAPPPVVLLRDRNCRRGAS
jgi:hypothetical protein